MKLIDRYFPDLTDTQRRQFEMLETLYPEWNEKINVISRRDIDNLEEHHLLHSLAISRFITFADGAHVLDLGSGGGLPGIPLAILFPNVHFHLIDRIGKKMRVASEIADAIGLKNVTVQHGDAGECHDRFDFVITRGVMPQNELARIARRLISRDSRHAVPNGLISLKGGDVQGELDGIASATETVPIATWFAEPFFQTKNIVYTTL